MPHDIIKCIQILTELIFVSILNIHKIRSIQIIHHFTLTPTFVYLPSYAAVAMATISVMLGVIFIKKGIFMAALTHWQMSRTSTGSCTP